MTNKFINYYNVVHEHASDLVNDLYDDLLDELKDASHGLKLETFLSWKDTEIQEYNNGISISLREAIEIIEQSNRLIDDTGMYINSGDCREQIKAMAYYTYRNDLYAEFVIALKQKLNDDLSQFEAEVEKLEEQIATVNEMIEVKENDITDLELQLEEATDNKEIKSTERFISHIQTEIEEFNNQVEGLNESLEKAQNLVSNIESI